MQVGARRVPALTTVLGHLVPARALLVDAVEIVVAAVAGLLGRLDETLAKGIGRAQVRHMQRAAAAMPGVVVPTGHALVAFGAAEIGQDVIPGPAIAAGHGPAIVVGRRAPRIDHGIERGTAAQAASARLVAA